MKGILLGENNELIIENGTLKIAETTMQDAYVVLSANQGEIKNDPIAGVNLVRMIRAKYSREKMRKTIEVGLTKVNINVDDIRGQVNAIINKNAI